MNPKRRIPRRRFIRRTFNRRPIYNNTSVNIQRIVEVPADSSGKKFTVAELTKDYFYQPKGIRIDSYVIKINLIDSTQKFTTYQVLSVLDDENNVPTVMTNSRPVNINGSICRVRKPAQRRFYTISSNELTELVLHFTAPKATTVFVDITTFFKVERDLIDEVPATIAGDAHYGIPSRNDIADGFEELTVRSNVSSAPPKRLQAATRRQ